jgi:hypothetical protein
VISSVLWRWIWDLQFRLWRTVGAVVALILAVSAFAIADDEQFVLSKDGTHVKVAVREVLRSEILRRLLGDRANIEWNDPALGRQPVTGVFNGSVADVVRQVLRDTNFLIAYSGKDTVTRVIVFGTSGQTGATDAAASGAATGRRVRIPPPSTPLPPSQP